MANVLFKTGTRAQFDALATKNESTLYWLTDTQELYKGDVRYGVGTANASSVVSGGSVKTVTTANVPYTGAKVGDLYLEIVFADENETAVYIPATDLVEEYTAGNGILITDHEISVNLNSAAANGLAVGSTGMSLSLATTTAAGAMSAVDKVFLDSISDTYATKTEVESLQSSVETLEASMTWETM